MIISNLWFQGTDGSNLTCKIEVFQRSILDAFRGGSTEVKCLRVRERPSSSDPKHGEDGTERINSGNSDLLAGSVGTGRGPGGRVGEQVGDGIAGGAAAGGGEGHRGVVGIEPDSGGLDHTYDLAHSHLTGVGRDAIFTVHDSVAGTFADSVRQGLVGPHAASHFKER